MFEIRFLGTSASAPSAQRGLCSALVMFESERFLIDCGEGTQRQILRSGLGFRRLNKVLLTHRHLDHILGLGGLASTFGRWGSMESMQIMGSPDTLLRVRDLMRVVFHRRWEPNDKIDLIPIQAGPVFETSKVLVEAFEVQHRGTPCFGFLFQEKARRRFLVEKAEALGVPFGAERKQLVAGHSVTLASNRTIHPDDVLGEPIAGAKLCFVSDVARTDNLLPVVADADLLVIEGTYLHRDRDMAADFGHLTVEAAARLAQEARVRHLVIHHVGRRYTLREVLQESRAVFPDTIVAADLDHFTIKKGQPLGWERQNRRPAPVPKPPRARPNRPPQRPTPSTIPVPPLFAALQHVPDPRSIKGRRHPLGAILSLAVMAMLCGARSMSAISQWGRNQEQDMVRALGFTQDKTPSAGTLHKVFRDLEHAAFEQVLAQWIQAHGWDTAQPEATDDPPWPDWQGEKVPGRHLVAILGHASGVWKAQTADTGNALATWHRIHQSLPKP